MKKVRVKSKIKELDITYGKIYEVIGDIENGDVNIIDDIGVRNCLLNNQYEEVKELNYVMVRDSEQELWQKRILLHDLGSHFEYRYITVCFGDDDAFINGEDNMSYTSYRQMKPINEVEQKIECKLKEELNKS